jgi:hypothetical protein
MSEFCKYVGIPWEQGANGPDAFDCGAFASMVLAEHFGRTLPPLAIPLANEGGASYTMPDGGVWGVVDIPDHGDLCMVLFPQAHYGVWLDVDGGGVLHCFPGSGVIFTKNKDWRFGRRQYLRPVA